MKKIINIAILITVLAMATTSCEVFVKVPPHPAPPSGVRPPPAP